MTRSGLTTVRAASTAAQVRWSQATTRQLTCAGEDERTLIAERLAPVASRVGADWADRFAAKTAGFALSTGVVFAAIIGSILWTTRISSGHAAAATTACAYLVIVPVVAPTLWRQSGRLRTQVKAISPTSLRQFLASYTATLVVAALAYGTVAVIAFNASASSAGGPRFYLQEFAVFGTVTVLGAIIAHLSLAFSYASVLGRTAPGQVLDRAWALTATAVTCWLPATRPLTGDRRLDPCLLCLLGCAATTDRWGRSTGRASSREARCVIRMLEQAAGDVERYALDQVPWFDTATRRTARHDGARLASLIRNAKASVAAGIHPGDYTAIAGALTRFMLAWARPDGDSLTTMMREATPPEWVPLWRRVAGRTWNAILLTTAGIALPLLPLYEGDRAAASGVRYALFTAAVLALATAGVPVWSTIEKHLERPPADTR